MNIFLTILIFYFGTAVGSFLSVLINRYNSRSAAPTSKNKKMATTAKSILFGRSMCPHCKTKLEALDLIPLASYLLLKGRCRYCEKEISPHYFYLELLTGIIFALLSIKFPFLQFLEGAPYIEFDPRTLIFFLDHLVISTFLIVIFFYDLLYQEIPDIFSLPPIVIALFSGALLMPEKIAEIMIGGAAAGVFFQGQILLSKGRWLGGGDVRLGILIGVFLGWKLLLVALFTAYLFGAAMSLYLLTTKKATPKTAIAFGPFLVTGTFFAIFIGNTLINWYLNLIAV